jgi:hypothetical protein
MAADQTVDVAVEGGREEHGLVGLLDAAQHPVDLGEKAHVGHAVGLVENGHLDVGHRDLAPVGEVDQPSRGGDDDVDALVQLLDLALDVGPAVEDDGPPAHGLGQRLEDLGHLDGQLPGGDEDEAAGPSRGRGTQAHEEGQAEGQGLARSGLGLAADVASGDGVGDGDGLDREGGRDALGGEDGHQFGATPSSSKVVARIGSGSEESSSSEGRSIVVVIVLTRSSCAAAHRPLGGAGPPRVAPKRPLR